MSVEYYSVVVESGYERVTQLVEELKSQGYEVLSIPEKHRPEMVPRGESAGGITYYVQGWRIPVENGQKPRLKWSGKPDIINA